MATVAPLASHHHTELGIKDGDLAKEANKTGDAGEPYYKNYVDNELTTDSDGITISSWADETAITGPGYSKNSFDCTSTATNYYYRESYTELAGYYDDDRNAKEFNSEEEKEAYVAEMGNNVTTEKVNYREKFGAIDVQGEEDTVPGAE